VFCHLRASDVKRYDKEGQQMAKLKYERKEIKKWAKENYKGLENALLASFNKDSTDIDEEGIRLDVKQSIKHGFHKTLIDKDAGTTIPELKRMIEIAVDEAQGKLFIALYLNFDSKKKQVEMLTFGEEAGIDSVLMCYPKSEKFGSEEDIFEYTKLICDSTDLAIDIYASHKFNFERFHPSTFSAKLIARLAKFENVAGLKVGTPDINHLVEVFDYCGDNIIAQTPVESFFPIFATKYGMQYAGASPYEFFQDTENRQAVTYFQLLQEGKLEEAMEIYWRLTPIRTYFNQSLLPTVALGLYNFNQWKYVQWLVGGAGGNVREPCLKFYEHDKVTIKNLMRASGIKVRDGDYPY
jgi:4-hydroxy-tetrahydrodipicolinate synthase